MWNINYDNIALEISNNSVGRTQEYDEQSIGMRNQDVCREKYQFAETALTLMRKLNQKELPQPQQ